MFDSDGIMPCRMAKLLATQHEIPVINAQDRKPAYK